MEPNMNTRESAIWNILILSVFGVIIVLSLLAWWARRPQKLYRHTSPLLSVSLPLTLCTPIHSPEHIEPVYDDRLGELTWVFSSRKPVDSLVCFLPFAPAARTGVFTDNGSRGTLTISFKSSPLTSRATKISVCFWPGNYPRIPDCRPLSIAKTAAGFVTFPLDQSDIQAFLDSQGAMVGITVDSPSTDPDVTLWRIAATLSTAP